MNKIVCDLCGTTYPDTAAQCPICGTARPAENSGGDIQNADTPATSNYTYVKGGRFSKKNVKKRSETVKHTAYREEPEEKPRRKAASDPKPAPVKKTASPKREEPKKDKVSIGLTIVAIILVVAILAVLGYIVVRFFLPADLFAAEEPKTSAAQPVVQTEPLPQLIACESITFQDNVLSFTELNVQEKLAVTLEPADTTDSVRFSSSDVNVVTVSDDGTVTIVGEGTAIITAYCGSASTQCTVSCTVPPAVVLELNRKEITFEIAGQTWMLYDGQLDKKEITWTSSNTDVVTVVDGLATAVAVGDATVSAEYDGQTVQCLVHCVFKEEPDIGGNGGTENEDNKTYKLYNAFGGSSKDVSLNVGSSFPLRLVDEDGNTVEDATWKVENTSICSYKNGKVKGLSVGTTKVIATYKGVEYTCIVRVR